MSNASTATVYLKMEATFEVQVVDQWLGPIDFLPLDKWEEDTTTEKKRLFRVAIECFHHPEAKEDASFYSEVIDSKEYSWQPPICRRTFLTRELYFWSYGYSGTAKIDLSEIDKIRIENGSLMLGPEKFSDWDDCDTEDDDYPEVDWFIYGARVPEMNEELFRGVKGFESDWFALITESQFICRHTRSPLANYLALPYALKNKQEFIDWIVEMPEERIRQLAVSPQTIESILAAKRQSTQSNP